MKVIFYAAMLAAATLMTTQPVSAQADRKLLSMEDIVLNRELTPKSYPVQWVGASDSYSAIDGAELVAFDARTGKRRSLITIDKLNSLLSTNFKTFPAYGFNDEGMLIVAAHGMRNIIDLKIGKIVASHKVPVGANLTRQSGDGGVYAYTRENNL